MDFPWRLESTWPILNDGYTYADHIKARDVRTHSSILEFYSAKYPASADHEEWARRIGAGQVLVNGQPAEVGMKLRVGDVLAYTRQPWAEPDAPSFVDILHEDAHMLVLSKPPGLQVLPAAMFHQRTVLSLLQQHYGSNGLPTPVHRLGRGTSGLLLCARTIEARRQLTDQLASKTAAAAEGRASAGLGPGGADSSSCTIGASAPASGQPAVLRKIYRALVQGIVPQQADEGRIDVPIGCIDYPGVDGGLFAAVPLNAACGKPASSLWRVLERRREDGHTLMQVEILTGRPHQIRIHMAAMGHPLVGDPLYGPGGVPKGADGLQAGAERRPGDCGYQLHAFELQLSHPATGEAIVFRAPPPTLLRQHQEAG